MPEDLPAKPKRIYDSAKFMGENVCTYYNDNMGVETVSLRFASTYGPGKTARHGPMAVMSRIVENPQTACRSSSNRAARTRTTSSITRIPRTVFTSQPSRTK